MQWQNHDGRVNFNQEVLRQSARSFSSSSDTKSSGFYNTALKWFHPFVISLLDFDYGGHCLSLVIKYLHEVAGKNVYMYRIGRQIYQVMYEQNNFL